MVATAGPSFVSVSEFDLELADRFAGMSKEAIIDALIADPSWLARLGPEHVKSIAEEFPPEHLPVAQRLIENQVPWRAHPALFANHLTDGAYQLWRHSVFMSERLSKAATGEDPHQIIMIGSQYGKTTALMWFILWVLDLDPSTRIMYVSYDGDKAVAVGGECLDMAKRYQGKLRFNLRSDRKAQGRWMTPEGGGLYCVGVLGGITGFPQEIVLCDDLFKGWEWAHSPAMRERVWNIYTSQVRMRLQGGHCPIIHVGTRWHEDDVPARLLQDSRASVDADQWSIVRLPTFAEAPDPFNNDPLLRDPDPLGRAPGELLCPERFDEREARARRASLGPYLWASLEQQRPAPLEGNVFRRDWWRKDLDSLFSGRADQWITSWDFKLKERRSGDYVAGTVWARTGKDLWLVDMIRGQWDQPTTENALALMMIRHPKVKRHICENTGNGPEVMDALRTARPDYELSETISSALGMTEEEAEQVQALRRRGMPGIVPHNPKGNKLARALACTGAVEAGDVHVPENPLVTPWLPVFLEEMSNFTGHGDAHDDVVDSVTQAIMKLHKSTGKMRTYGEELRNTRATSVG